MDAGELGTILGVWAHPDDEAYLSAGLMAGAVAAGNRVVCVTATRGEQGSLDHVRWPPETMAKVREKELLRSLEVLGVTEHIWLDHADGGCADVDQEMATARVRAIMDEVQPRTVLSFGLDGMTGHPDHVATCEWTMKAFHDVAPAGSRLYHATKTPEWVERWAPAFEPHNVFMVPGTPPRTPRDELGIDFHCEGEILHLKVRAITEHISQVEGLIATFGAEGWRESMIEEPFRLAAER